MEQNQDGVAPAVAATHDEWATPPTQSMTIAQMNNLVMELNTLKTAYEEAKEISDSRYKEYDRKRNDVLNALQSQGLDNYKAPGVGLVYKSSKEVYRVPSDNAAKTQLFNYIKNKFGLDTLMTMTSINHQTLNSWANKEAESGVMQIPGLEQPTIQETVGFRRS